MVKPTPLLQPSGWPGGWQYCWHISCTLARPKRKPKGALHPSPFWGQGKWAMGQRRLAVLH
eukprot:11190983-Lingulodinium_polyedra.AAC.1